jgi:predicted RNase H-like HicB family nuclease
MYKIDVFYSHEDEGYIAVVPELPGCSAFGETKEEALEEIEVAKSLWLATAAAEGRTAPVPHDSSVGHRLTV